ncbi:alpha-amylase [Paenibacillus sp. P3E]|uniref:alpha-amylase family glycosyl hydrolase n=1 Tax=Paenibacillus sp. P3E TaxID=1349435 RepID=UPI00093C8681|nr:alpha-amylase family glycosyl hydrolase [Paenibacillus sp. P3E]OKP66163.1 alpha-amylase [Paenibacillus sp. P3E]
MFHLCKRADARRLLSVVAISGLSAALLAGCSGGRASEAGTSPSNLASNVPSASPRSLSASPASPSNSSVTSAAAVDEQPSTVFYEIFVRSFYDSDGDGIGDLKGITEKLDYLNDGNPATKDDLGIGGIWLMPINPSPSYHGYDVTDYRSINPDYGTIEDMQNLLTEAHKRGIKVIMDLVVNHTSRMHPWFVDSAKNKDGKYRNWYVWAEDQHRPVSGTSAAGSGNPWHPLLGSHYMGTFWDGMPDLNFDNPQVRSEMKDIGTFWLKQGVDGFRLDAAKHIYEDLLSDKSAATTAKNVAWWQEFRQSMSKVNPEAYIVGEVWENSAVSVGAYLDHAFNSGFNFGLAESLINSAKTEKDSGVAFTLERTYKLYSQLSGNAFTDATFLTNHDQNRVMSQLQNQPQHAKMAASMLLTLPGNPFIYYGEEIGMLGVKPDEGIREPMRWTAGQPANGQTTWEPGSNNDDKSGVNVASQLNSSDSLLERYRQLISIRGEIPALRDGDIRDYPSGNAGVMAYERITSGQQILVAHNLTGESLSITIRPGTGKHPYLKIIKVIPGTARLDQATLTIPPYTTVIME